MAVEMKELLVSIQTRRLEVTGVMSRPDTTRPGHPGFCATRGDGSCLRDSLTMAMVASLAGLVAGAMSKAAGEYVSVSSQADTDAADVAKEMEELRGNPAGVSAELAAIYVRRGLP